MAGEAALSALELEWMQYDNEAYMMDTAVIMHRTNTDVIDSHGQPGADWVDGDTIACGFGFSPFKFRSRELAIYGGEETSEILVRARVPISYSGTITTKDRLRLTHLKGVARTDTEIYDIQGFEEPGPSALVLNLKRVEV